jgi:hypothetical protein
VGGQTDLLVDGQIDVHTRTQSKLQKQDNPHFQSPAPVPCLPFAQEAVLAWVQQQAGEVTLHLSPSSSFCCVTNYHKSSS